MRRVHPRVCGEALHVVVCSVAAVGPSPRVRGSPPGPRPRAHLSGSIPACAGKPRPPPLSPGLSRVHPRVCGEAATSQQGRQYAKGPSPRVRGSPSRDPSARGSRGSIPACAGKPPRRRPGPATARVHPRVCGEAGGLVVFSGPTEGPSPRVRGSREEHRCSGTMLGSIPACAGKPCCTARPRTRSRVHPRVCGEASGCRSNPRIAAGPSPRVRGSPGRAGPHDAA